MIQRRALAAILVAAFCVSASAGKALANWQYTRWGMTKAEVVEASGGQAVEHVVAKRESWGVYPDLVAPFRFEKYAFRAFFYFNNENGQLTAVRLDPIDAIWCPDMAKALMTRYGSDHRLVNGYFVWLDDPANDRISLSGFSTCRIKYEPLQNGAH